MVHHVYKRGVVLSFVCRTAGFETHLAAVLIKSCPMFGFGALEGQGNIAVLQMQLQPPHLIMILLKKKSPR